MNSFPCTRCGECCKHASKISQLKEYAREDGVCKHLQDDNLCEIYKDRPFICRIDDIYDKIYSDEMTKDDFIAVTLRACKELQSK